MYVCMCVSGFQKTPNFIFNFFFVFNIVMRTVIATANCIVQQKPTTTKKQQTNKIQIQRKQLRKKQILNRFFFVFIYTL